MRQREHQAGFSTVVEIVLVLVIVGLIGVVGWMVYRSHNKATNAVTTTAKATSTPTKSTTSSPSDEQTISTVDKKVQVTIPNSWHVIIDSNNPNGDQVISVDKNTHICDKYNPSNCSAIAGCLNVGDTVPCLYEAEFQPKALVPQKDNVWGMTVEKTNMTIPQASEQLLGDLTASNTLEKSTNEINGYNALYLKVKGGDCSAECYVDIHYFVEHDDYLVHFNNREQYTNHSVKPANQNYVAYSADFAKIANSLKLSL